MPGIDFNRLRHEITMEQVLDLLGFECVRRRGDQWYGYCPLHKSEAKHRRAFSVNVCEGCYYCHKCRSRGDQFTLWTEANKMPLHPATIMRWCESNHVDFVLGLAKNARLKRALGKELHQAKQQFEATGTASRVYKDFSYKTRKSWSRKRRVIGKAEHLAKGQNPRFVVTSLTPEEYDAATVYEQEYCARGDMENRIKEQQLYLFADRTSAATMRANQLRLWLSSVAYVIVNALRELGLKGTELEKAQCHTIRLKLFKIGAAIRVTVRKVWVSLSTSYPFRHIFMRVFDKLRSLPPPRPSPG